VNSWFVGHPDPMTPRFRQEYELGIQVDPDPRIGTLTLEPEFTEPSFGEEESIEVVCVVVSDDFAMLDKPAKRMRLPRDMRLSSSPVTFRVQPIRNNQNVRISVLFYQGNNLFHEALVGATVQVVPELQAELVSAYFKTRDQFRSVFRGPRDMNLQIIEVPRGYRMVLFHDFGADDADAVWCTLPFNRAHLSDLLDGVRNELLQALHIEAVGPDGTVRRVFFEGEPPAAPLLENRLPHLYDVQREAYENALRGLARAGRRLFVGLFSQTGGTPREREEAAHMGDLLTELSKRGQLRIQVLSDEFFIPWNLLYTGQFPAVQVDPTGFWGFRHIIEEIPFRTGSEQVELRTPTTSSEVSVAFNINRTIEPDPSRSQALVEPHLALARSLGRSAQVAQRFEEDEVLSALRGEQPHSVLEYFYCHAGTGGQASQDFDQSYLGLTDSESGLTLEDIKLATFRTRLDDGPLFFLNACESGRMDGRFYDGFAPKFLSMGASAVVGTDCEVPSLFAAHFGLDFLHALLAGEQVGEILLRLRQKFLEEFHNPLGLVYRAFGNVDTRTAPTASSGETNR
jgi:hypothetical protein